MNEFIESSKHAREFIEDVISSAITNTTDAPPETRIRKPEDEIETINLTKKE